MDWTGLDLNWQFSSFGSWFLHQFRTELWHLLRFLFLHTLFFFELYFEPYLIGTKISWSLDHIFWSYLLILSLDHILSDRWSYLTDDLMFLTFLWHVLDTYFGYYLHALDMCYTWLTPAIHFQCCTSHAHSMFTYDLRMFALLLTCLLYYINLA